MNQLAERRDFIWYGTGFLFLLACFFCLTSHVIFAVEEEWELYYIVQKGDFLSWLNHISHETGRITFYVLCWFWGGPMFLGPEVYKIYLCVLVALDFLVFFRLLYVHASHSFAFLCTTMLILFLQISNQHNLVVTYAYLHVPFILVMLSFHWLLDYTQKKKGYQAVLLSALCNGIASFFQENFVLFYIPCFFILFFARKEKNLFRRAIHSLWELRFHVLGGLVFLGSYFLFRASCGGGTYNGISSDFSHPLQSLRVLITFMLGMLPGLTFGTVPDPMAYLNWKNVLLPAAGSLFLALQLYRMPKITFSKVLVFTLAVSAVLSCLLHAFSPKYMDWVANGTYAYVPSYYAYFFLGGIAAMLVIGIYQAIPWRKLKISFLLLFSLLCTTLSTAVSVSNQYFSQYYQERYEHYLAYQELFQTCAFSQWKPETQILLQDPDPTIQENTLLLSITTVYHDAAFSIVRDAGELEAGRGYYILNYGEGTPFFQYIPPTVNQGASLPAGHLRMRSPMSGRIFLLVWPGDPFPIPLPAPQYKSDVL